MGGDALATHTQLCLLTVEYICTLHVRERYFTFVVHRHHASFRSRHVNSANVT